MRVVVAGGGIGGLAAALFLHARGIEATVYEQSREVRELGVGINTLPHAIGALAELGLLPALDAVALRTRELFYLNRFGQEIWREGRGTWAGHLAPQFSIHRGRLQGLLLRAVTERLGERAVRTGRRLVGYEEDGDGVTARFADASGAVVEEARADALVAADGIHSTARALLHPGEGPPRWNGVMLWRGALDHPAFLDGASMIVAGDMAEKLVLYPIAEGAAPGTRLTNWALAVRLGADGDPPPRREDWNRPGRLEDVLPHLRRFAVPGLDVEAMVRATVAFYEYPMCDRDPLASWASPLGRVTLLGDAAHPMHPVGSNGASQAVLDARALAGHLAAAEAPDALCAYEAERRPATAEVVRLNRLGGPERVVDVVSARAPEGFARLEDVASREELAAIVAGYAATAGFAAGVSR